MGDNTSTIHSTPASTPKTDSAKEAPAPYIDTGSTLPENYGQTIAVLLPRDPFWMFSYWEITDDTAREIKQQHGEDIFRRAQPTIRMHEISTGGDTESLRYIDVPVILDAKNWYLSSDKEGSSWFVELGLKTPDGKFIVITRSNRVTLPMSSVSNVLDEKWATIKDDLDKIWAASGGGQLGAGSLELSRRLSQRWLMLTQASSWRGSGGVSSFGRAPMHPMQKQHRSFWMVADCELIVYGATEPDATLTVAGKPVELFPDGTFSLRFPLPDVQIELPIKAVSGDQVDERVIKITVERRTERT